MTYGGVANSDRSCPKCQHSMVKDGPKRFYCEQCGHSESEIAS